MWFMFFFSMFLIFSAQNDCFAMESKEEYKDIEDQKCNVLFKVTKEQYIRNIADKEGNVLFRIMEGKLFKNEQGKLSFTIKQEHEGVTSIELEYTPRKEYIFYPYYYDERKKISETLEEFYSYIDKTKRRTADMCENIITMLVKIRKNIGNNIPENKKNEYLWPVIQKLRLVKSKLTSDFRVNPSKYNARWDDNSINLIGKLIKEYQLNLKQEEVNPLKANLETLKKSLNQLKQKLTILSEKLKLLNKKLAAS